MEFLDSLASSDRAAVFAAMSDVATIGMREARHLRGEIYEVRAQGENRAFRVLFAREGHYGQILLSLEGFAKKTQRTPPSKIELAEQRLRDWRSRAKN